MSQRKDLLLVANSIEARSGSFIDLTKDDSEDFEVCLSKKRSFQITVRKEEAPKKTPASCTKATFRRRQSSKLSAKKVSLTPSRTLDYYFQSTLKQKTGIKCDPVEKNNSAENTVCMTGTETTIEKESCFSVDMERSFTDGNNENTLFIASGDIKCVLMEENNLEENAMCTTSSNATVEEELCSMTVIQDIQKHNFKANVSTKSPVKWLGSPSKLSKKIKINSPSEDKQLSSRLSCEINKQKIICSSPVKNFDKSPVKRLMNSPSKKGIQTPFISNNFSGMKRRVISSSPTRRLYRSPDKRFSGTNSSRRGKSLSPIGPSGNRRSLSQNGSHSQRDHVRRVLKFDNEEAEIDLRYVNFMLHMIRSILSSNDFEILFDEKEKKYLGSFICLSDLQQYFVFKLFMYLPKWYPLFEYCKKISLIMSDEDTTTMFNDLKEKEIIDSDYHHESIKSLLGLLPRDSLKEVCLIFRLKPKVSTKETMISMLLKNCKSQSIISTKSPKQVLLEKVQEKLGCCVKLNDQFRKVLKKVYLLFTLANSEFLKPQDFFHEILNLKRIFPTYKVDSNVKLFENKEDFEMFIDATELKSTLREILDNKKTENSKSAMLEIGKKAFASLKSINNCQKNSFSLFRKIPHLKYFTPEFQYVKILIALSENLTAKHYVDVRQWLQYILSELDQKILKELKTGICYKQLALIEEKYYHNYDSSAEILIRALKLKESFSEIDLEDLAIRARRLKESLAHKISDTYSSEIKELLPDSPDREPFPTVQVKARTMTGNDSGRKRAYMFHLENGDKEFMTVEEVALNYYKSNGYTNGLHCEGSVINAIFLVFFWDIIYFQDVEAAFISNIQMYPLDYKTKYFYENRKKAIDDRLNELVDWTDEEFKTFFICSYSEHCEESLMFKIEGATENYEILLEIIECMGRSLLKKILERLSKHPRRYRSGMPDLIVWNISDKKCKFAEVKSDHDKLSTKQKFWLQYLRDVGADIELCLVKSKFFK